MSDETLLYGPRDYSVPNACERIAEVVTNISNPRILLWTNPKRFEIKKSRFGEREIELGYRRQEEDFINGIQARGDRWRWERATDPRELQQAVRKQRFHAVVILGTSQSNVARKAVYYLDSIGDGPKTLLLEFDATQWAEAESYAVWHYLNRTGHLHFLRQFVHLTTRMTHRKYLPTATTKTRVTQSVPIWEIASQQINADHIERLFYWTG